MSPSLVDLRTAALHLDADLGAVVVDPFAGDHDSYIENHCTDDDPGRLVSMFRSEVSWGMWEIHPEGDEVVIVVSGRAAFLQDFDGKIRRTVVGPLQAIVNPAGVPHTADVLEPFTAIYVTPGPGTEHLPREGRDV